MALKHLGIWKWHLSVNTYENGIFLFCSYIFIPLSLLHFNSFLCFFPNFFYGQRKADEIYELQDHSKGQYVI